jgi:hypothetical protein
MYSTYHGQVHAHRSLAMSDKIALLRIHSCLHIR